jgi:hypothetical protein
MAKERVAPIAWSCWTPLAYAFAPPLRRNPQASRPNCADDAVIFDAQAFQHDPEVAEEFAVEAFIAQLVMKALRVSLARGASPGR